MRMSPGVEWALHTCLNLSWLDSPVPTSTPAAFYELPPFEGTAALWRPILLGHELAHLAFEDHDSAKRVDSLLRAHFDTSKAKSVALPPGADPGGSPWTGRVARAVPKVR